MFIEIKCGSEIFPALKKALAKSGMQSTQAVIIAFDTQVIAEAMRQLPQVKTLWLTDFKTDKKTGKVSPSAADILSTLEKIHADGVDCRAQAVVNSQFMQMFQAAHKEVHVWTVDDVATARRLGDLGIDSLTSNRAGLLKQQFDRDKKNK